MSSTILRSAGTDYFYHQNKLTDNGGRSFLEIVAKRLPDYTASHTNRMQILHLY
jgi:hypothetical protein